MTDPPPAFARPIADRLADLEREKDRLLETPCLTCGHAYHEHGKRTRLRPVCVHRRCGCNEFR